MYEQDEIKHEVTTISDNAVAPEEQAALRRRKVLAMGGTALLATSASRPVWAGGTACTPSALASVNASGIPEFQGCSKSSGWWETELKAHRGGGDSWPVPPSTPFHNIFGMVKVDGEVLYQGKTLAEVIQLRGSDPAPGGGTFGKHLVAAYCNAATFPSSPAGGFSMTVDAVLMLFATLNEADAAAFSSVASQLEQANNEFDGDYDWL